MLSSREGGPAWRAGIRGTSRDEYGRLVLGDIITSVDGARVRNSSDLYRVLDKAKVRTRVFVVVGGCWGSWDGGKGGKGTGCVCVSSWACVASCPTPAPLSIKQSLTTNACLATNQPKSKLTGRPGLGHPRLARQLGGDGHRRLGGQRVVIGYGWLMVDVERR